MVKRTLVAVIIVFSGGVLVGHYLVPPGQYVGEPLSETNGVDWTRQGPSVGMTIGDASVGRPRGSAGKSSLPQNVPGASRRLPRGQATRLREEYAQVLRDLGLHEEDVGETIATFTLRASLSDDEIDEQVPGYRWGPSAEELEEELKAALMASGIFPAEAGPMAESSVARSPQPDPGEEKRLRSELKWAVAELGIPPGSVAPAPED